MMISSQVVFHFIRDNQCLSVASFLKMKTQTAFSGSSKSLSCIYENFLVNANIHQEIEGRLMALNY